MVRVGLGIYLMFVTLAGPLLCPCNTPFIRAAIIPTPEAPRYPVSTCRCCPRPLGVADQLPQSSSVRASEEPDPAEEPCTCPTHGHNAVANTPERLKAIGGGSLQDRLPLDPAFTWAIHSLATAGAVTLPRFPELAFTNSEDLLHFFQILRC